MTLAYCDSCNKDRESVVQKRLMRGYAGLCPDCLQSMKWTSSVLTVGTDWVLNRMPKRFVRSSKFSVTPLDTVS